ncbi:uncharacterized protein LOC120276866 [Dioscorea cayenensis subsp. rotundata]|uniref:Uncharacterized protein LOC120276866 n=1 Tax=Dioscorea cayennensis subsp. rotundata TaxID=55577 RepID=A0AB40CHP9_DIOCR|nr:uncharacterized protein LOC120276866 [Dioscorea cayenensis subsp. rotundata]XP_039139530.1 uncharacterized protein LOC120276866 [Dioscorea cayenensis subsp. rotundata]
MARRYSRQEEALEIKSLRRILSAYLNYSDAAEEDVRRYERSFAKLSPAHKDLLSHLPVKYKRIRWCISVNTFFIMSMLQAFEPPIEMNQGVNFDDHDGQGDTVEGNPLSATLSNPIDRDVCSEHLTISGSHVSMHLTLDGKEENNLVNDATRSNGKEALN